MGNSFSGHKEKHLFEKELKKINSIIGNIITDDNIFKNKEYNFLSQNVCTNYQLVLESELSKHLKVDIKQLGTSLYVIPKNNTHINKQEICEKIINHYIKLLYVLCLIKYVYNLEEHGDLSIMGIIFRNIKITDDLMEIRFCGLPHKNYADRNSDKIDFGKLSGMKFFVEYFLTPEEGNVFMRILQSVLSRSTPSHIQSAMCHDVADIRAMENLYMKKFNGRKLKCGAAASASTSTPVSASRTIKKGGGVPSLFVFVQKDNPILLSDYCGAPMKIVVKLNTKEGKEIYAHYMRMKNNFDKHLENIHQLLYKIVDAKHELKDIDKDELNIVINDVKTHTKLFYLQSIVDFQNLLDMAKETPNIHIT
jgi:hypothetical protein